MACPPGTTAGGFTTQCVSLLSHRFFSARKLRRCAFKVFRSVEPPFSLAWLLQPLPSSLASGVLMNPSTAIFACNALIILLFALQ